MNNKINSKQKDCWGWAGKGFFFLMESPCFVETTSLILAIENLTVPLSHKIRMGKSDPRRGTEGRNKGVLFFPVCFNSKCTLKECAYQTS